jgi:hypothetical protein
MKRPNRPERATLTSRACPSGFPEDEGGSWTGWRQQRIENGPSAISCARRLEHLANAGILNIRQL